MDFLEDIISKKYLEKIFRTYFKIFPEILFKEHFLKILSEFS